MPARPPTTDRALLGSARREPPQWLHSRLVLAGTAVLAASVVLLALAFVGFEQRELQRGTLARNTLFARVLDDQANRTLTGAEVALGAAAEGVRLLRGNHPNNTTNTTDPAPLSALLQQSIQTLPFLRSLSLVDAQGRVLASSNSANVGQLINRQRLLGPTRRPGLGPLLPGRDLADLEAAALAAPGKTTTLTLLPLVQAVPVAVVAGGAAAGGVVAGQAGQAGQAGRAHRGGDARGLAGTAGLGPASAGRWSRR